MASNINNIEENDLVDRLKQGQEWAFNTLVHKYQNMLLKIAYGITLDREESLEIGLSKIFALIRTDFSQNLCFGYCWYHKGFRALNFQR